MIWSKRRSSKSKGALSIRHGRARIFALATAPLVATMTFTAHGQPGLTSAEPVRPSAPGNLNITPKRLVLDRGARAGTVYIFNQGSAPATFDISLIERVMLPNGEIKAVEEARVDAQAQPIIGKLASAQSMLVAAPRRVTLAPGKGQTIRVRAMQPATGAGEHRTHLTVTTLPPRDTGVTAEQAQDPAGNQLGFRITSVFSLSIPVIVRSSPADARGAFENVSLGFADLSPDGTAPAVRTPVVRLDLRRLGSSSLFGNLEVKGARGRERDALGLARGVGVYPEIDKRTIQLPLRRAPRPGEQLTITFTDDDSSPGQVIGRFLITAT